MGLVMARQVVGRWSKYYEKLLVRQRKIASKPERLTLEERYQLGAVNREIEDWKRLREAAPQLAEALGHLVGWCMVHNGWGEIPADVRREALAAYNALSGKKLTVEGEFFS